MKTTIRLAPILLLMLAGSFHGSAANATHIFADPTQKENPFVGVWEPAPNQDLEVFIKSLWVDEDGTFAAEMTGGRENQKGTYTVEAGKLLLETEEFKKLGVVLQGVITQDGRLKLTKSKDDDSALYFVKR
jgi:hypothetical protein